MYILLEVNRNFDLLITDKDGNVAYSKIKTPISIAIA